MQKKNRKGFTLIELLAVIVILAIIALIAVPVIMNVITKARISAFEDSAYGIVKAGEMYYTNKLLDAEGMTEAQEFTVVNDVFQNTKNSAETLELSGSMPSSGKVTVTSEGKVAIAISNGEYCIRKATTESKVKAEKLSDLGGTCNYKTVFTTASDGTEVPACIANNTTCSTDDIKNGLKVGVKVNDGETKDFYVIKDNTEDNEITLIMSENIGISQWVSQADYIAAGGEDLLYDDADCDHGCECSKNDKGPITALNYLENGTSSWTNIPSKTYQVIDENNKYSPITRTARARLITETEATILGCTSSSGSCPTWLYENTNSSCEGDFASSSNGGYWTSSAINDNRASDVYSEGSLSSGVIGSRYADQEDTVSNMGCLATRGIRPVITVSKTIL